MKIARFLAFASSMVLLGASFQGCGLDELVELEMQRAEYKRSLAEQQKAVRELQERNRVDIDALKANFKSPDVMVRRKTAIKFANMGAEAQKALPELLEAFHDPEDPVRSAVAMALGHITPTTPEIVGALSRGLEDDYSEVRWAAALSLGRIGPPAKGAIPRLEKMAQTEPIDNMRRVARESIGKIRPGN